MLHPSQLHIPTLQFILDYLRSERACYATDKFMNIRDDGTIDECAGANEAWRQTIEQIIEWITTAKQLADKAQH